LNFPIIKIIIVITIKTHIQIIKDFFKLFLLAFISIKPLKFKLTYYLFNSTLSKYIWTLCGKLSVAHRGHEVNV